MKLEDLPKEITPAIESLEVLVETMSDKLNEEWDIGNPDANKDLNGMLYAIESVAMELKNIVTKYSEVLD